MDTTFLSYLLTFCLAVMLVVYLYQITEGDTSKKNNIKNLQMDKNGNVLGMVYDKKINSIHNNDTNNVTKYNNKHSVHKKNYMPVHPVGPVHNFHQSFNKYKNMPDAGYPTGIPEMGWRNLYLANYSDNLVVEEDSFSGIPTRHFLDNLDNVKNIYREES
jgi:hypothetical protein